MNTTTPEDKDILPILDRLGNEVPAYLSIEDRCKLIQRISRSVVRRVSANDMKIEYFEKEDKALARLFESIPYSERWIEFCCHNAIQLADTVHKETSAAKLERLWPAWDEKERMDFLHTIAQQQISLFAHDGLTFKTPKIVLVDTPPSIRGLFNKGSQALSQKINDRAVEVSRHHFNSNPPLSVAQTIWHEHIHSICQQFAAACDSKTMSPLNPFLQDAEIMRQRHRYGAHVGSFFRAAYNADPEEILAFSSQYVFAEVWNSHSSVVDRLATRASRLWHNLKG